MLDAESNHIEYKRELDKSDKLEKAVVSFLNYNGGGEIIVGVADDGSVVGIADTDGDQRKIADRLGNNIHPKILGLFDVVTEKIEDKNIIRIVISSGMQKPYYIRKKGMTEDGCFVRVGASAQPMTEAMIERLLQHRQVNSLFTTAASRQKLTFEQLHIYYNEHGLKLNEQFEDNLDLRNGDGAYNFLAYLLADTNGASMKVAKYAGTNKIELVENEEYGYRCLITAIYRVMDKFAVENKTYAKITSRDRLERKLIHPIAFREAFINAVVHNDYSLGWPVVEFFSDRVTITSTGGLVEGLSQEDFFSGRSMLRNRELMRVFKDVELVEGLGSGMQRILEAYDRNVFEITPSFIIVTFPYASDFERSVSEDVHINERSLSEADLKKVKPILDYLKTHDTISPQEARKLTGKSAVTVRRYLTLLCEFRILKSTGNTSAKSYRVMNSGLK
ncbi:MAG: putative DNA binding domain-containing protein [Methanomicrobiales archaeon]|jgi:predicted HTH transcriptional regulator|nr:putative DNA binding domain-containing protein [Methanomicrobiales archaeon]